MPDELRLALGFLIAAAAVSAAVPVAIRLAHRTGLIDRPGGYKQHSAPTPYLGGLAVMTGVVAALIVAGPGLGDLWPLGGCALALLAVGTLDDRVQLGVAPRLTVEIGCAVVLFAADLGLEPFSSEVLNFAVTVALVLGVVNAYNLMDNLDGAAATIGAVTGGGIGLIAAIDGATALGVIGLALCGACLAFLRFNLAVPSARIFLGDGGSMSIGILACGLIMALPSASGFDWGSIAVALLLVGLPALDTALVIASRKRRGVSILTGGRDHLTHRLLAKLGSPREVALVLAAAQAGLIACAALAREANESFALLLSAAVIAVALAVIAALEAPRPTTRVVDVS